jgi:hypothetical protein
MMRLCQRLSIYEKSMKFWFSFLAIFFSTTCFASSEDFLLLPKGVFVFEGTEFIGRCRPTKWVLKDVNIRSYEIFTLLEPGKPIANSNLALYGTVEKLNEWTRAYAFKVNDKVLSIHRSSFLSYGSFFDCLKNYEVISADIPIGYIKGNYSTDANAEFLFFNDRHELFARATLSRVGKYLEIRSPDEKILVRGFKTLHVFDEDSSDSFSFSHKPHKPSENVFYFWMIHKDASFDAQFLWPFIGFIAEVWWE